MDAMVITSRRTVEYMVTSQLRQVDVACSRLAGCEERGKRRSIAAIVSVAASLRDAGQNIGRARQLVVTLQAARDKEILADGRVNKVVKIADALKPHTALLTGLHGKAEKLEAFPERVVARKGEAEQLLTARIIHAARELEVLLERVASVEEDLAAEPEAAALEKEQAVRRRCKEVAASASARLDALERRSCRA